MSTKRSYLSLAMLLFLTALFGYVLLSSDVLADDSVIDDVNITVPESCTMTGVGMNSHNATISPGTWEAGIGETTVTVFCNNSEGFTIYAIGYTNDTEGNNTLKSTNLTTPVTIPTGTGTSGNSQWAMLLSTQTSPTPAYPLTILSNFDSYHVVPDTSISVAKRVSGTDVGTYATGASFTTTYRVYIASAQAAGTYVGKVKYTMVQSGGGAWTGVDDPGGGLDEP